MIEVNVHHRQTGERLQSHIFKNNVKANQWMTKYNQTADCHQLRLRSLPDQPSASKSKILAIAIPLGLTAIGICYFILHKWG